MTTPDVPAIDAAQLVYCGRSYELDPGKPFDIGREADLVVASNPYLHRRMLRLDFQTPYWWLTNVGARVAATVTDAASGMQAWLPPEGRIPLVFANTSIMFTAGPTTYELTVHISAPQWKPAGPNSRTTGTTTMSSISFTLSQRQLIVALAEDALRHGTQHGVQIPSNRDAAKRLGWALTRFNRKLDNVCDKLDRFGIDGVRGGPGALATQRRSRLVEYAVATGLVTAADLQLLDQIDREREEAELARRAQLAAAKARLAPRPIANNPWIRH